MIVAMMGRLYAGRYTRNARSHEEAKRRSAGRGVVLRNKVALPHQARYLSHPDKIRRVTTAQEIVTSMPSF